MQETAEKRRKLQRRPVKEEGGDMTRKELQREVDALNASVLAESDSELVLHCAYGGVEIHVAPKSEEDGTGHYPVTYGYYKPAETWERLQQALSRGDVARAAAACDLTIKELRAARAKAEKERARKEKQRERDRVRYADPAEKQKNLERGRQYRARMAARRRAEAQSVSAEENPEETQKAVSARKGGN